ncbi:MAG: hypothetical protein CMJ18_11210 [Phycisphaeraceae bacterium]|nr:hypothetical protein [Phycisphaeraceae bacterium]
MRHAMFALMLACMLACMLMPSMAEAEPTGVDLARLVDWDIVIPEKALPVEVYAARELRAHIGFAIGLRLPVFRAADRPGRHIFVGESAAMRDSAAGFSTKDFGPEQLRIVVRDDVIAIAGGRPRGTLYGVYTFLEDYFGVRFLTGEHTHVPPVGLSRVVEPLDRSYDPPFTWRWSFYGEVNRDEVFAARVRCNTVPEQEKLGGKSGRILINHSFGYQIPTAVYGKDHPEYFCEIDGRRLAQVKNTKWHHNEPCLTNPQVLEIVTAAVLNEIEAHPQRTNVSVSQNDNDNYCRCTACAALDEREGTPMGSLLTFVNGVADRVAQRHPQVKVGTLAFWYSRQRPATVRPRPNVQIQLCSSGCSILHPINDPDCELNTTFCRDLRDWSAVCDDVAIWNYNTNFRNYLLPCPNLRVIEPNVRFFRDQGVKAVFMQGAGNAEGAELSELRNYMIANLLWDPSRSGQALMDEFLTLHYRSAAPPIRAFIDLVHDNAERRGIQHGCFGGAADYGIDASVVRAGLEAFETAMQLADNGRVRERVEKASICVHRAAVEDAWLWILKHRETLDAHPLPAEIAARTRPHARRLFRLCARHGVDWWRENIGIEEAAVLMRKAYGLGEGERF